LGLQRPNAFPEELDVPRYDNLIHGGGGVGRYDSPQADRAAQDMMPVPRRGGRVQDTVTRVLGALSLLAHPGTGIVRLIGSASANANANANANASANAGAPPHTACLPAQPRLRPGDFPWRLGHHPTREELAAYVRTRDPVIDATARLSHPEYERRVGERVRALEQEHLHHEPRLRGEPPRPWERGYQPNDAELEAHVLSVTLPRRGQAAVDEFERLSSGEQRRRVNGEIAYLKAACNAGLTLARGIDRPAVMTQPAWRSAVCRADFGSRGSLPRPFPWRHGHVANEVELEAYVRTRGLDAQERQMFDALPDDARADLVGGKVAALLDEQARGAARPAGAPQRPWEPGYRPNDAELRAYVDTVAMPNLGEAERRELAGAGRGARNRRAAAEFNHLKRARETGLGRLDGAAALAPSSTRTETSTARFEAAMRGSMAEILGRIDRAIDDASRG
jgi:hypothetical protein